jgi:hypothetical protein
VPRCALASTLPDRVQCKSVASSVTPHGTGTRAHIIGARLPGGRWKLPRCYCRSAHVTVSTAVRSNVLRQKAG